MKLLKNIDFQCQHNSVGFCLNLSLISDKIFNSTVNTFTICHERTTINDGWSIVGQNKTPGTNHNLISQFPEIIIKTALTKCTRGKNQQE